MGLYVESAVSLAGCEPAVARRLEVGGRILSRASDVACEGMLKFSNFMFESLSKLAHDPRLESASGRVVSDS
jgi:hypothetical protein